MNVIEREIPARSTPHAAAHGSTGLYNPGSPIFETQDIVAMVLATVMALGPLSAYALGYGL